jgi:hypothetical protein
VIHADRDYYSERHRRALRNRAIEPVIAEHRTAYGRGLGKYHWVVERTHAWLHHSRRLRIRCERRADIHGLPQNRLLLDLLEYPPAHRAAFMKPSLNMNPRCRRRIEALMGSTLHG